MLGLSSFERVLFGEHDSVAATGFLQLAALTTQRIRQHLESGLLEDRENVENAVALHDLRVTHDEKLPEMDMCFLAGRRYPKPVVHECAGQITHTGYPIVVAVDVTHEDFGFAFDIGKRMPQWFPEVSDQRV